MSCLVPRFNKMEYCTGVIASELSHLLFFFQSEGCTKQDIGKLFNVIVAVYKYMYKSDWVVAFELEMHI